MASIIVCGGSVVGLSAAMLLAGDGHDVTVLERDPASPPADPTQAWDGWGRTGVAQFHQPHNLFPRFRQILDDELPGLVDALVDAGCVPVDPLESQPPTIIDRAPRPGDDRFRFVTGRRPVIEAVLARAAAATPGVTVRRGLGVAGLMSADGGPGALRHVTGVRTASGEVLGADLVVDATGRRSRLAEWLEAIGAGTPTVEAEDSGFVYHTRYFAGPRAPRLYAAPISEIGTITILTLPGDNDTWSVTVFAASADVALKGLRDPDRFTRVVSACPLHKHWLKGESITDVLTMAGILDRYRRFVVDGRPVATGVAAVGDAWACTNPSAGRGMTVGLIHAQRLRDVVRSDLHDPTGFALAWDRATEAAVAPFYREQIRADRARIAEMDALREGRPAPAPDPVMSALSVAMLHDPEVFRGALDIFMCLALPDEVFSRPGLRERVETLGAGGAPFRVPGPDRATLLDLLA